MDITMNGCGKWRQGDDGKKNKKERTRATGRRAFRRRARRGCRWRTGRTGRADRRTEPRAPLGSPACRRKCTGPYLNPIEINEIIVRPTFPSPDPVLDRFALKPTIPNPGLSSRKSIQWRLVHRSWFQWSVDILAFTFPLFVFPYLSFF